MVYWRLHFHDGPWDGQTIEIDRDPQKIELNVFKRDRSAWLPHETELWVYDAGIIEGEVVHMMGSLSGRSENVGT